MQSQSAPESICNILRTCPEAALLIAFSRIDFTEQDMIACDELLLAHAEILDWGRFIHLACRHRVLPLVGRNIVTHQVKHATRPPAWIPNRWLYQFVYEGSRRHHAAAFAEFGEVVTALLAENANFVLRKGPLLSERIYNDVGARLVHDLDILAPAEAVDAIGAILGKRGYRQGKMSRDGTAVESFDRRTKMFWSMHVSNSLPYLKLVTEHAPGLAQAPLFVVDIARNIFPASGADHTATLLQRATSVTCCGRIVPALDPVDALVDLCVHLHKEADARYYIQSGKDLTLLKFLDVAATVESISRTHDLLSLVERSNEYGVADSVYFALHHTAAIFSHLPLSEVLNQLRPADESYLNGYGYLEGAPEQWTAPFATRLFDDSYHSEVVGTSAVPHGF